MNISPGTIGIIESKDAVLLDRKLTELKVLAKQQGFANAWHRLSAKDCDFSRLQEDWQNLSFFGGEVYIVSGCELWKKAQWEQATALLDMPLSSHCLMLCGSSIDQRLQAVKRLKEKGWFVSLVAPERRDWMPWALNLAKQDFGLDSSPEALRLVGEVVGQEPWQVIRALELLALYLYPRTKVDAAVVAHCFGQVSEETIFTFTKAVANRDRKNALCLLDKMLRQGLEALYILAMLRRHYKQLIQLGTLASGTAPAEKAKAIACPPYFLKEYEAQLRLYRQSELIDRYHGLATIDSRLKSEKTPPSLLYSEWIIGLNS